MIKRFKQAREDFFIKNRRYPSDRENQRLEQNIRNEIDAKRQEQANEYRRLKNGS